MSKLLDRIVSSEDVKKLDRGELEPLCGELRAFLVDSVSKTGGHLASNLGIVELTVALHRVFDPTKDRILFDVGHQSYVHKLLTGRREAFPTLRRFGGLSGFPKPGESDCDPFIAGHASDSISLALGMARARTLRGEDYDVVAVLGDGAMTGGLAYEGMNNAGQSGEPLIVILNDNGMSITRNVGGIAKSLARQRTKPGYYHFKRVYRRVLLSLPGGERLYRFNHKLKTALKVAIFNCSFFEEMGFHYLGPVDGHDVKRLEYTLEHARSLREPVLLHVVTKKGKGYAPAERDPDAYHAVGPFDPAVGLSAQPKECFSAVFGRELCALAEAEPRLCAVTAAMPDGTGLVDFARRFPERFFDEGIAEGHAVSMAAGMAKQGMIPVFAVYSTFLQRGYDMLLHDVAILGLHVVFAVDRAGLVGADGETHQGVFDVGYLRQIPGLRLYAPASYAELRDMLRAAVAAEGPVALRYPRGGEGAYTEGGAAPLKCLRKGSDLTLVCYGTLVNEAAEAAELLEARGVSVELLKLGQLKPLDPEPIRRSLMKTGRLAFPEEAAGPDTVGRELLSRLAEAGDACPALLMDLGERFVPQGTVAELLHSRGLDAESIARRIIERFFPEKENEP